MTIGVHNDFRSSTSHSDELWFQGGGRLCYNVGEWDSELSTIIGDPGSGTSYGGVKHEWRINNSAKMTLNSSGLYLNDGWFRTYGSRGWYNETHGGGWYMTDSSWVRAYNGKGVHASQFEVDTNSSRDKFRVYPTSQYCIGMQSGVTFGDLNDWAMTFQMNNDNDRGFWWGDDGHNTSQGAMSLSTRGWLSVAERILVGAGQSSTGGASYPLDVRGKTRLYESTGSSPSTTEGTLILQHGNSGGTSSIVFPSARNRGSDYGYISYSDSNYSGGERARLRIGTSNDADDDIILQPTGDVGINNDNPSEKLDVTGNIKASGRITGNDADFKIPLSLVGMPMLSFTTLGC